MTAREFGFTVVNMETKTNGRGAVVTPSQLHAALLSAEVDGDRDSDTRRVLSAERQALGVALARASETHDLVGRAKDRPYPKSSEYAIRCAAAERAAYDARMALARAHDEALRVAGMWGVEVRS